MTQDAVPVTGVWLQVRGGKASVGLEIEGKWVIVIEESEGTVSHIVELSGIRKQAQKYKEGKP